uniref:Uncharacterized protein n=1 Tax=Avena sativa TaxID=4498 RepID=A0ACD5Y9R8_AVESA
MRGGEDDPRDDCCVRRRLHGDASRRCIRAAAAGCIGSGVKDLAGAPLQYAGDVRHSLPAEPDSSMRNGEDIPRRDDSEDRRVTFDDSSIVVLIGTPADGGTLVRGGIKIAAADVFLADPDRNDFMARFWRAIELGPWYWVQELIDWLKRAPTNRFRDYWSWRGVVGVPIMQRADEGTCVICGTLVCLEARHRLDFERRHGFRTFPYRIPTETVAALKNLCEQRGVWTAKHGANVLKVLKVIQGAGGSAASGVPGWKPCSLQVKSWKYHRNSLRQPIPHEALARLIHSEGPLLGTILVDDFYHDPRCKDGVYRGVPQGYKGRRYHLVVCSGYYLEVRPAAVQQGQRRLWHQYGQTETELYIEVVDNHTKDGPVRCILARAFTGFIEVHVEPLDARELRVKKPSLWRRLIDFVSPQHHA